MSFIVAVEILNFILASLAALISLGILRKVTGNLAASWRYAVIAFQILALATLFAAVDEIGVISVVGVSSDLLRNTAHFVFIILAFFGLLRNYQLIRKLTERDVS